MTVSAGLPNFVSASLGEDAVGCEGYHARTLELYPVVPEFLHFVEVTLSDGLAGWLAILGGLTWATIIYVAPTVFLVRVPLPRRGKALLGIVPQ